MDLLRLTPSELLLWGSSLKDTRDIWGGPELSGIRMRMKRGAAFSQTEMLAEVIVPFMSPLPTEPAGGAISEILPTWLTLFAPPW